uniref:RDD family protein n=1 Tax=Rhabdothermincola sp. TaxID=2820405 RepID=UPI002FDF1D6F
MTTYLPGGDPTAVGGRRIVGYLIDWVLFFSIIPGILFFATAGFTTYTDGPTCTNLKRSGEIDDSYFCTRLESTDADGEVSYDTLVMKKNAFVIANAFSGVYLVVVMWLLQGLTGATIGKLVVGIRTVNEQGRSPGLGKQLIRGIVGIVDAVPFCLMPLVPVVGLITIFVTKGHRRVGDMAAKTYVVKASAKGAPIMIPGVAAPA